MKLDPMLAWLMIIAIFVNGMATGSLLRRRFQDSAAVPRMLTPSLLAWMCSTFLMNLPVAVRLVSAGLVIVAGVWLLSAGIHAKGEVPST